MVYIALQGMAPWQMHSEIRERSQDQDFLDSWEKAAYTGAHSEVALSADGIGEGWIAEQAVPSAMYSCLKSPDDFEAAVLMAANTDGDSDSIATITGSVVGAKLGIEAIPIRK